MTVPQCIEKLEKEGGQQVLDTVLALKQSWTELKAAWGGIFFFCNLFIYFILL